MNLWIRLYIEPRDDPKAKRLSDPPFGEPIFFGDFLLPITPTRCARRHD